jgi:hypothetical protein
MQQKKKEQFVVSEKVDSRRENRRKESFPFVLSFPILSFLFLSFNFSYCESCSVVACRLGRMKSNAP